MITSSITNFVSHGIVKAMIAIAIRHKEAITSNLQYGFKKMISKREKLDFFMLDIKKQ